jgi:hypothetical protein
MKSKIVIMVLLVFGIVGCASTEPKTMPDVDVYLTMLSGNGYYSDPIKRSEWVATDFAWYISRDVKTTESIIKYRALFDNRVARGQFLKTNADPKRKENYPAFVVHEGTVNCDTQDNTVNEIEVRDDFKTEIRQRTHYVMTEVAQNLCLMHIILHK